MPKKKVIKKSQKLKSEGKASSTQAGPFVEEEIHQYHEGKSKIKSEKQAIAIGLSKARQAGIKVPKKSSSSTKKKAKTA